MRTLWPGIELKVYEGMPISCLDTSITYPPDVLLLPVYVNARQRRFTCQVTRFMPLLIILKNIIAVAKLIIRKTSTEYCNYLIDVSEYVRNVFSTTMEHKRERNTNKWEKLKKKIANITNKKVERALEKIGTGKTSGIFKIDFKMLKYLGKKGKQYRLKSIDTLGKHKISQKKHRKCNIANTILQ